MRVGQLLGKLATLEPPQQLAGDGLRLRRPWGWSSSPVSSASPPGPLSRPICSTDTESSRTAAATSRGCQTVALENPASRHAAHGRVVKDGDDELVELHLDGEERLLQSDGRRLLELDAATLKQCLRARAAPERVLRRPRHCGRRVVQRPLAGAPEQPIGGASAARLLQRAGGAEERAAAHWPRAALAGRAPRPAPRPPHPRARGRVPPSRSYARTPRHAPPPRPRLLAAFAVRAFRRSSADRMALDAETS